MLPCFAPAQQKEIERYRELLQDGNPSELFEARGAEHWKAKRGPKNASLEQCDLGLGPGVVKGAYVRLPRYFADADRVQDLESRLVTCMVTLQGFTPEEAKRKPFSGTGAPMIVTDPFSGVGQRSVMTDLVAWIASESRGMTIAPSTSTRKSVWPIKPAKSFSTIAPDRMTSVASPATAKKESGSACRICRK